MKVNLSNTLRRTLMAAGRLALVATLLLAATGVAASAPQAAGPSDGADEQQQAARHLVVENVGQFAPEARFQIPARGRSIWLTDQAIWLAVTTNGSSVGVRFSFPGANTAPVLEPFGRVDATVSYLVGTDPAAWHAATPVWGGVRYRDLYPGVDLVVGGDVTGTIPWRLEARPGADLRGVTLRVQGATATFVDSRLQLEAAGHRLDLALPSWSSANGDTGVDSAVVHQAANEAFVLAPAAAPAAAPADVEPTSSDLIFSVTTGGSALDAGYAVAVDFAGSSYVTGETQSNNFPTLGPYDATYNGAADAFVAKYDSSGGLKYATYLGGSADDMGWGIAVEGNLAYVVGETASTNFPVIGASVVSKDIFVAALNAAGSGLRYVTRLGGNDVDYGYGIAVQDLEAYVVGQTFSTNLSGANCSAATVPDLVVAKLSSTGALSYTSCLGGSDTEIGSGIALRNGEAFVTGQSYSANFPGGLAANSGDVLVARFNANGSLGATALVGGSGPDAGQGIAVDDTGNIYVTGTAGSNDSATNDFPVTAGTPGYAGGLNDAIVLKLSPALTLSFATYLGGPDEDDAFKIAVDTVQALYVAGATLSNPFRTTAGAYDTSYNGGFDPFAARLHLGSTSADKVTYSTYLGGAQDDYGFGGDTDTGGNGFLAGSTQTSPDPATSVAALWKLKMSSPPSAPTVSISASGSDVVFTWPAVTDAAQYQVIRSALPYHKPGNGSTLLPLANPALTTQSDAGVLPQINAYFYLVKAINTAPAAGASSNQVGKITFQLVKGG